MVTEFSICFQLPLPPDMMGASFYFYTPEQSTNPQIVFYDQLNESVGALRADFNQPFTMVVHGFAPGGPNSSESWSLACGQYLF
jgi:hypothetical protein